MTTSLTTAPRSLLKIIHDNRRAAPDRCLVTFVDITREGSFSEETRTSGEIWMNGSVVADGLQREGMKSGDSFGLVMQNHPEFLEAMVGSSFVGTVYVPIDPRTQGDKLRYMLELSGCRGAIVADYALSQVLAVAERLPALEWIWVVGHSVWGLPGRVRVRQFTAVLADRAAERSLMEVDAKAPMQMLFTSGTTGDPKAILSPHGRFMYASSLGPMFGLRAGDRPYTGLSLTHANAQLITLGNAMAMGLQTVVGRRFTRSRLWELLSRYECTTFNLLGGMAVAIYAEPSGRFDTEHKVRFVLSAGMPGALWNKFRERFGIDIFEFYGTAEGGLTLNPPGTGPIGSIGKPPDGITAAVLGDSDRELEPEQRGELCFRNSDGTVGEVVYFKNPIASAARTSNGWFRSGDIGWRDKEGWLYFAHRSGTAIRRNGEFIAPSDVEAVLAEMPCIADVFVYGIPTRANAPGEREVVAALVPTNAGDFDSVDVFNWCEQRLPSNARPACLQIVKEIPKTASEKPQERHLLAMLQNANGAVVGPGGPTNIAFIGM